MEDKWILVVDDEQEISDLIRLYLTKAGFTVHTAGDGTQAMDLMRKYDYDLAVLDVMLPEVSGLALCRQLRDESDIPVIFVSCKGEEEDKINGLEVGDDYVTKPFSPGELVARVKTLLRRTDKVEKVREHKLFYGNLAIDLPARTAYLDGEAVCLSATEFQLLTLLACNPERVYSAEQLFEMIWNSNGFVDARTVKVHISNLRKKIENDPDQPQYILTRRGFGYQFNPSLPNL